MARVALKDVSNARQEGQRQPKALTTAPLTFKPQDVSLSEGPSSSSAPNKRVSKNMRRMREKRQRNLRRKENFTVYVFKVLKEVHPELSIANSGMAVMDDLMNDMFTKIAKEAADLSRLNNTSTLTSRDVMTAVKLIFPGELAKCAVEMARRALARYKMSYN